MRRFGNSARWLALLGVAAFVVAQSPLRPVEADSFPQVELSTDQAGPRQMEKLTESSIRRNYAYGWQELAEACDRNEPELLGDFVGPAHSSLAAVIAGQMKAGLHSRYLDQNHKVQVVFYAPEGDVVELHDTATYEYQVADGDKTVHDEHATIRYVVLMTPGADRWLIRQLQAVPEF
jgi:hypothetical protein